MPNDGFKTAMLLTLQEICVVLSVLLIKFMRFYGVSGLLMLWKRGTYSLFEVSKLIFQKDDFQKSAQNFIISIGSYMHALVLNRLLNLANRFL